MMSRVRISLEPEEQRRARRRAAELGISFAEYVRRLIARDLGGRRKSVNVSVVFNLGTSRPGSDVAREKDAMVGQAVTAERRRRRLRRLLFRAFPSPGL